MRLLLAIFILITATEAQGFGDFLGCGKESDPECSVMSSTRNVEFPGTDDTYCGEVPTFCEESKYRSSDGSCNNLEHSWWGTPFTPYARLLPNSYRDGIHEFPRSVTKKKLPNPRKCSLQAFVDIPKPDPLWTVLFMQFGQTLAHDLSLTTGVGVTKKDRVSCCVEGKLQEPAYTDPRCAPILLPKDDPFNAPEGRECMDLYRTETTHDGRQCMGVTTVAEPLTAVTAFLDVSFLYGSDSKTANNVRDTKGGRLRSEMRNGREVLTQDPEPTVTCEVKNDTEVCYLAGDVRINQNPQLAVMHNLYMLLHNYIANALAYVNPHWEHETLFQETRRIVIALHQHIIYYEFLPSLIGEQNMIDNNLIYPGAKGFINDYDPSVNPAVLNECATAALRFYHTEIVGNIKLYTEHRNLSNQIDLSDWLDRPSVCEHGDNFNGFTRGLATQPQSKADRYMTNEVLNNMFKDGYSGVDLKALDIQRGRDHGLGTYAQVLRFFGLSDPKCFNDFVKFIKPEYVEILRRLYKHFEDVDLTLALSLENIIPFTVTTPTVQAIVTEQFYRTRVGDRYFYENGYGKGAFTLKQLNEIRRCGTIASLLCQNPGVKLMQTEAFKIVSNRNPLKTCCYDIPWFDPTAWKENI